MLASKVSLEEFHSFLFRTCTTGISTSSDKHWNARRTISYHLELATFWYFVISTKKYLWKLPNQRIFVDALWEVKNLKHISKLNKHNIFWNMNFEYIRFTKYLQINRYSEFDGMNEKFDEYLGVAQKIWNYLNRYNK